jgi:hypothetical protein
MPYQARDTENDEAESVSSTEAGTTGLRSGDRPGFSEPGVTSFTAHRHQSRIASLAYTITSYFAILNPNLHFNGSAGSSLPEGN